MTNRTITLRRNFLSVFYLFLSVLLAALLWVAFHALADDARPTIGQRQTTPGERPIIYYDLPATQVSGKAETILFVASLGRSVSDFNELRESLSSSGYRTIAVESRGIVNWQGGGFSSYELSDLAHDLLLVIANAGIAKTERVHIVGHAFGNRVARTFATVYPEQTASLVLIAAGDKTDNMPPDIARDLRFSTFGFMPWSIRGKAVTRVFFSSGHEVPEYWKSGWSTWGALGQVRAAKSVTNKQFNAGGSAAMLVLQAQDDLIAPAKDAGELLKASYGERVKLVPILHAGHALLPEQPDLIAQSMVSFLQEHPAK